MEKYIPRKLTKKLVKHLPTRQIFAILGPRQAGKTTLFDILQEYLQKERGISPQAIFYFSFEDPEIRSQFNHNPKEFVSRRIENLSSRAYFFFDEYHWAKEGGQKLKLLFDLFSPQVKFFITGSSSLEVTFQTGKFLVGRVFYFHLYPFSFEEFLTTKEKEVLSAYQETKALIAKFTLPQKPTIFENKIASYFENFCLFGGYPEVSKTTQLETKQLILKSIINTYLEKDIRSLLLIEDLEGYRKLLGLLGAQIGNLLSYNQLSSDSGLDFKSVKKYLTLLEETYVVKKIRPFYRNLSSELRKNPKLYFADPGLRNFLLGNFASLEKRIDKGSLVENFVFSQFIKEGVIPNFWRTKGKAEVDFVFLKEGEIVPVEVKFQFLRKPLITRSFLSFLSCYQPKYGAVLTKGFYYILKKGETKVIFAPVWYW